MSSGLLLRPFSAFVKAQEDYVLALDSESKSPETIARLRNAFLKFERLIGQVDPSAIDAATLRRFVRAMKDSGLAASTQRGYLNDVKGWLTWLHDEDNYGVDLAAYARAKGPSAKRH